MSLADLVNSVLGRRKETEEDMRVAALGFGRPESNTFYATSQATTRTRARRELIEALPAPVGSEVYAQQPDIQVINVGPRIWHGRAAYTLVEGYEPPASVEFDGELAQTVLAEERQAAPASAQLPQRQHSRDKNKPARQTPYQQARAVSASGTGYTPSVLEQRLWETAEIRHYR